MNHTAVRALFLYGAFVLMLGVAGFLSNPAKAKTALIVGAAVGLVSVVMGIMMSKGAKWTVNGSIGFIFLTVAVTGWRAALSWISVSKGKTDKLFVASLISTIVLASLAVLPVLWKARRQTVNGE